MQHFYILRHGQSEANAHKQVTGSLDSPLSATGRQQANIAGETAKLYYSFDYIVTSPLSRAFETAEIIAKQLHLPPSNIQVIDELRERDLGELEGMPYASAPRYDGNYEDAENAPGIEPIGQLYQRADQVLHMLAQLPYKQVLIVCHNGIGRMLRVVALRDQPLDLYKQARMENAIIYPLLPIKLSK